MMKLRSVSTLHSVFTISIDFSYVGIRKFMPYNDYYADSLLDGARIILEFA